MTYLQLKETEARLKYQKSANIKIFLEEYNGKIEYNGEIYFILLNDKLITTCNSTNEIHSFVLGWLNANDNSIIEIQSLKEANAILDQQNKNNIEMYENLIHNMNNSEETLTKEIYEQS